jgi:hypothetical protein
VVDERKKMIVLLSLFLLSLLPGHSQAQAAAPTQAQAAAPTQVRAAAPTQVRAAAPTQVRAAAPAQVQAPAPASNVDLQKVITQLNTAATKFVSAQADFTWDQYTAAVQESDLQSGTIYFERKKGVTLTAAHIKKDNGKDAPKTVAYRDGEVQLYEPTIKQLTILKA